MTTTSPPSVDKDLPSASVEFDKITQEDLEEDDTQETPQPTQLAVNDSPDRVERSSREDATRPPDGSLPNILLQTSMRKRQPGTQDGAEDIPESPDSKDPAGSKHNHEHSAAPKQTEKPIIHTVAALIYKVASTLFAWRYPVSIVVVLVVLYWLSSLAWDACLSFLKIFTLPLSFLGAIFPTGACDIHALDTSFVDFPQLLQIESVASEQLLDITISSSRLAIETSRAETAIEDLTSLVRDSELGNREDLADLLHRFTYDVSKVIGRVEKLAPVVIGMVDQVNAANDFALRTIQSAAKHATDSNIPCILSMSGETATVMPRSFDESFNAANDWIEKLTIDHRHLLDDLRFADAQLVTIREVAQANRALAKHRDGLFVGMFSHFGKRVLKMREFQSHPALLKSMETFPWRATAQVNGAIKTLEAVHTDLARLRDRVDAQVGRTISLDEQLKSLNSGMEKLTMLRDAAAERNRAAYDELLGVRRT
ncbi:hypothetical protein BD410DRAFT_854916 [Rickenella mellea]|uniref:Transmembrane protein n=1 Tax=Rickenella mellea TaxID=50990 RepID=A0A4Y7PJR0_9AGAM|nr:hypothetical protein BD410DRAFT_854916 [Rickenella mellea]